MSDPGEAVTVERRALLRRVGGVTVGSTALAGGATPAAASHTDHEEWPFDGGLAVKHFEGTPTPIGYEYVGSVQMDDLCALGESTCVIGGSFSGLALAARSNWLGAAATAAACSATVGTCEARAVIERRFGRETVNWVDVYVRSDGPKSLPPTIVRPRR